ADTLFPYTTLFRSKIRVKQVLSDPFVMQGQADYRGTQGTCTSGKCDNVQGTCVSGGCTEGGDPCTTNADCTRACATNGDCDFSANFSTVTGSANFVPQVCTVAVDEEISCNQGLTYVDQGLVTDGND